MPGLALDRSKTERSDSRTQLRQLLKKKSVLRGDFKLASGGSSQILFDVKKTVLDAEGMRLIAQVVTEFLKNEPARYLGGLELGAIPVIIAACMESGRHALMVRKEAKGRGTNQLVEGDFEPGSEVIVLDDVTTKGNSVMHAVSALRERGLAVRKVLTVIDRLEGAEQNLRQHDVDLRAIFRRTELE